MCGRELPANSAFCPTCGTPVTGTATSGTPAPYFVQPQPVGATANYASVGDRAVAIILDTVILAVVSLVFLIPIGIGGVLGVEFFSPLAFFAFPLLWWLVGLFYFTFFEGTSGQTIGKQAVGIKVVDGVSQKPVNMERALLRSFMRIIDMLPFLYFVGFILVETQPQKKRLGDALAGTIVVKA